MNIPPRSFHRNFVPSPPPRDIYVRKLVSWKKNIPPEKKRTRETRHISNLGYAKFVSRDKRALGVSLDEYARHSFVRIQPQENVRDAHAELSIVIEISIVNLCGQDSVPFVVNRLQSVPLT